MNKNHTLWLVFAIAAAVVIGAASIILLPRVQTGHQTESSGKLLSEISSDTEYTEYKEKWQEGEVTYRERKYRYNGDNRIYLIMGIDKDEKVQTEQGEKAQGGCADAMFLLVANRVKKTLSVVSIDRNTMSRVAVYAEDGRKLGYYTLQLCLQHAYGDGGRVSCNRTVDAVSYLFEDLPISGYIALNMSGIPVLNDAVGGVPVKVSESAGDTSAEGQPQKDTEVTLSGEEAFVYLRERDNNVLGSASDRLRRQEEYLNGLFIKVKETVSRDENQAVKIYESLKDYMVTDLDMAAIIQEWIEYEYDPSALCTVPGKTVMGDELEEYRVDEKAFRDLIMKVFYTEVTD